MDPATVKALRDTKQLLDDGTITEADFAAKKAELLGQGPEAAPEPEPEPEADPEEVALRNAIAGLEAELGTHHEQNAYYEGENQQITQENAVLDGEIALKSQEVAELKVRYFAAVAEGQKLGKLHQLLHCDIRHINEFNCSRDVERIERAIAGWGADERMLLDVLCSRSKEQLLGIARAYETKHGKALLPVLKSELAGFLWDSPLPYLVRCLLTPPEELDVEFLHDAMAGWGTNDGCLIEVLGTRSAFELKYAADNFKEKHGKGLREAVDGDTSGKYSELLLAFVDAIPSRREGDKAEAEDVIEMYATSIHAGLEPDSEDCVAPLEGFLPEASEADVTALKKKYAALYGDNLLDTVLREARFDSMWESEGGRSNLRMLLLARLHDAASYGAVMLDHALKAGFLAGGFDGVDEKSISRVLGRHDKNFVFKIAKRHDELFPEPLKGRFEAKLSGDFRAACLGICFGANESDVSAVGE
jgi:hypothetical protein